VKIGNFLCHMNNPWININMSRTSPILTIPYSYSSAAIQWSRAQALDTSHDNSSRLFIEYLGYDCRLYFRGRCPFEFMFVAFFGKVRTRVNHPPGLFFIYIRWQSLDSKARLLLQLSRIYISLIIESKHVVVDMDHAHWLSPCHFQNYHRTPHPFSGIPRETFPRFTPTQSLIARHWKAMQGVIIIDEEYSKASTHPTSLHSGRVYFWKIEQPTHFFDPVSQPPDVELTA